MSTRTYLVAGAALAVLLAAACQSGGGGGGGGGEADGGGAWADAAGMECDGCRGPGGTCLPGYSAVACGEGGESCQSCGEGSSCQDRACVEDDDDGDDDGDDDDDDDDDGGSCRADCNGCCSGDSCLAGASAGSCGSGGAACVDCGDGFSCAAGTCQVEPTSRWDLTLLSATVSEVNVFGNPWDAEGLPDVYVDVYIGSGGQQLHVASQTIYETASPVWNQMVATDLPAARFLEELSVAVVDRDGTFTYNTIGHCPAALDSS